MHFLLIALISVSCHKKGEGHHGAEGGGTGNLNFAVTALPVLVRTMTGVSCSVMDGNPAVGNCYTPHNMSGTFNKATITNFAGGKTARLLGGGSKYHGLEDVFRQAKFDLSQTIFMDGDDNLQDNGQVTYTGVAIDTKYLDIVHNVMGKYIHVRYMFVDQPATLGAAISGCSLDVSTLAEVAVKGLLWTGATGVYAGDILACVKATSTEVCANTDYQWIDSSTGALLSTRSNPLRLAGSYTMDSTTCSNSGSYPDMNWGGIYLYSQLNSSVTINAAFDRGQKIYTSGSSMGHTMNMTLGIDTAASVFVPSSLISVYESQDYNSDGATFLKNLDKITLRQIYEYNNRQSVSTVISGSSMFDANLTIAISETEEANDGDDQD